MKKAFGLFTIILSFALVIGCESNKNSENKVICIGSEDDTKQIMTGTFENDKLVKIVREEQTTYDNDEDLNNEYSMSNTLIEYLNNTVDGIDAKVSKDGMTVTIKATMDMKKLDKNYKEDNNLNISTVLEFKDMAKLDGLTCD